LTPQNTVFLNFITVASKLQTKLLTQLRIIFITGTFVLMPVVFFASKIERGYEALKIYDYFQAKKLFTESNKKAPDPYGCYGLAIIYCRNDNPFTDIDSAAKYIRQSYHSYILAHKKQTFSGFVIDSVSILHLADSIARIKFVRIKRENSADAYNRFLKEHYLADKDLIYYAVYARDELEFDHILRMNKSDTTKEFIATHPQSGFYKEALLFLDREIYDETTIANNITAYTTFLEKYPGNVMVNTAYEKLFGIYRQRKDIKGLAAFVKNYPKAPQGLEAWKLLFSLTVKSFSSVELKKFLDDYPDFPLKNSILKDLELNKLVLYPYQQGDFSGFIDVKGKFVIKPVYDAATDFYEGLSVVSKNDSVYFINKENVNPFNKIYQDASVFKNGIAPVKENGKWYFINRQGQSVSKFYDEINELSDNVYVVKVDDRYGALDYFGQVIIEPKFDKLGDFKNGYAYYTEKGSYGFVSRAGSVHKAEFEWISDFNSEQIAVIKQNNKYGLVNVFGKIILEPEYDQVIKTNSHIFIVVQNGLYGFFSSEGCFLTPVAYDFQREKSPEYYTNGKLLKLLKKGEQAFMDENGRLNINFGAYQEINFAGNDLIRVKQKNKYGYADRKLNMVIGYKYQEAEDFSDSTALVKFKDNKILLNTYGSEVFSTGAAIEKISAHYFMVNDDSRAIINNKGDLIYTDVDQVQKINHKLLIVTINNGEIKLLYD
jgi:hypothetical protein